MEEKKRHQDYQVSTVGNQTAEKKCRFWGECRRGDSSQTDQKYHIFIRISAIRADQVVNLFEDCASKVRLNLVASGATKTRMKPLPDCHRQQFFV